MYGSTKCADDDLQRLLVFRRVSADNPPSSTLAGMFAVTPGPNDEDISSGSASTHRMAPPSAIAAAVHKFARHYLLANRDLGALTTIVAARRYNVKKKDITG